MEPEVSQIIIAFIVAMTTMAGAVTAYVRRAIKRSDEARTVALEAERTERTNEIEAKSQRMAVELENERKAMEVRIVSEQTNSEQAMAMSAALTAMADAFGELSKNILKQNQLAENWRNTYLDQHQSTLALIESSSAIAGEERQQQIGFLQQILAAVTVNGGVGHGGQAVPHLLKLPPG